MWGCNENVSGGAGMTNKLCPSWIQFITIIPLSRHGVKKRKAGRKYIKLVICHRLIGLMNGAVYADVRERKF